MGFLMMRLIDVDKRQNKALTNIQCKNYEKPVLPEKNLTHYKYAYTHMRTALHHKKVNFLRN